MTDMSRSLVFFGRIWAKGFPALQKPVGAAFE
jgi:hypothetical protein